MTDPAPGTPVRSPPFRLLTMGVAGLHPPATVGVGGDGPGPEGHSGGLPLLGPGKPLALLTFLALSPGRSASREFLLDLLWADLDADRGRHALRQTIWQLRQLLGHPTFEGREEIRLALELRSDRDEFLAAIEAGDLAAAVSRYTGPFLPAFASPGGAEFEQWADREREHLRGLFLRAADTLARRHMAAGRPRDAVRLARRLREADPLHEGGWRLLLEALAASGDRVQALVEADALEELLRLEGRDPEPATRAALRAARQAPDPGVTAGTRPPLAAELVGREREFSAILHAWDRARHGPAALLHVMAPPGLGKSRLLQDVHSRLRTMGARTVMIRANAGERDLHGALAADLAGVLGELPGAGAISPAAAGTLVALNPALSSRFPGPPAPADPGDQALPRAIALAELVAAVAYEAPLAILVDDLHWADAHSLRMLRGIQPRIASTRTLLITTSRPNRDTGPAVTEATILPLAPLAEPDVSAMLASIARPPDGATGDHLTRALWHASGGSPFLVLDILQRALDQGHLLREGAAWQVPDLDILLAEIGRGGAVAGRLATLDRPAAFLLTLLATAGRPCSSPLLARAAAREGDAVLLALAELERRGFVSQHRGEWAVAHDEIAAAVLDVADETTQRAAARAIGEALAGAGRLDNLDLALAVRLLVAAGEPERVAPLVGAQRPEWIHRGARRKLASRLAELLGQEEGDPGVTAAVTSLAPRRSWRRLSWAAAGLAGTGLAGLLVTNSIWAGAPWSGRGDDAALQELVVLSADPAGALALQSLLVDPGRWAPRTPLHTGGARIPLPPGLDLGTGWEAALEGRQWALLHAPSVDNRLTHDIARTDRGGTRILVSAPRDDLGAVTSPDGAWIAFATSRWSPVRDDELDLALTDSAGTVIRRLTSGPAVDAQVVWDPSGTRLAFVRRYREVRPAEACTVSLHGEPPRCRALAGMEPSNIAGWLGPEVLLVQAATRADERLVRLDLATGATQALEATGVRYSALSPDGQWLLCQCSPTPSVQAGWYVHRWNDPEGARPVIAGAGGTADRVRWNVRRNGEARLVHDFRIVPPPELPVDVHHQLRVEAATVSGTPVALPGGLVRWHSGDTTVAQVDAERGLLSPRREGRVTVHADAGGGRRDSVPIVIRGRSHATLLEEDWRRLDPARWRLFGDPQPVLVTDGPLGPSVNPNGDGSFPSGLYSLSGWDAGGGLGFELALSTPIRRLVWQTVGVSLVGAASIAALREWDHRSGYASPAGRLLVPRCTASFPAGEGALWVDQLALGAGSGRREFPLDSSYRSGRRWQLRVQLFPDGSCGFAVDERAIWRSPPAREGLGTFHIWLTGHAVQAPIRFGLLAAWSGVRPDLDWSQAPMADTAGSGPASPPHRTPGG